MYKDKVTVVRNGECMLRIKTLGFAIGVKNYFDTELKQNKKMFLLKMFGHLFVSC